MSGEIRWGILGAGKIARKFASDLPRVEGARLVAVASRSADRANAFGTEFGVSRCYASYEELAEDLSVDVVYVATRNSAHFEAARICLEAGKAVLCEKTFTINHAEAQTLVNLARQRRLFLMEAMWTRCFPAINRTREILASGVLGDVRLLSACFGFVNEFNPESRLFNPNLGGGALLDLGIYPISLASLVFGQPSRITSLALVGSTGVDEQEAIILGYEKGQMAVLSAAIRFHAPKSASICGTKGSLTIGEPFWKPRAVVLSCDGKDPETFSHSYEGLGYQFEIAEVMNCLRQGKLESQIMPLDETLAIMETLDALRAQWGLRFPMEPPETKNDPK